MRHDSPGHGWLIERYRRLGYDAGRIAERYDQHVEDVLVNVFYALALRALARLDEENRHRGTERAELTEQALLERSYDDRTGLFFDLAGSKEDPVRVSTWSSLAPLALPGVPEDVRRTLVERHLLDPRRYAVPVGIPSVSREEPSFKPGFALWRCWRGPSWMNTAWLLVPAIDALGYREEAGRIVRSLERSVRRYGFREYYNPLTGRGLGRTAVRLLDPADRPAVRKLRGHRRRSIRLTPDDPPVSWRSTRAAGHGPARQPPGRRHRSRLQLLALRRLHLRQRVPSHLVEADRRALRDRANRGRARRQRAALGRSDRQGPRDAQRVRALLPREPLAKKEIHTVATSAIRDASNRAEFIDAAGAETGLEIEILSAEDEAFYGYVAAANTTTITDGVVLEIGGGSMQLIRVADRRAHELTSFPLGAVRLTEEFLPDEGPARKKALTRVREYVRETLADLDWLEQTRLVGLGGAVRNLAAAALYERTGIDIGVQGLMITSGTLTSLVETLAELPVAERGEVPGIKPGRADIILAAAIVLETVVDLGGFDGIEVTEAGLREGIFLARTLLKDQPEPLFPDVREAAVRNLAVQYESDMTHVEHVAQLSLQMFDSLAAQSLLEPRPESGRCCGPRRCSTTWG